MLAVQFPFVPCFRVEPGHLTRKYQFSRCYYSVVLTGHWSLSWVYILPQNLIFSLVRANVSLMILVQKNLFTECKLKKFGLLSIFTDIFANF